MNDSVAKYGGSFWTTEEVLKQVDPVRIAQDAWMKAWREQQQLTLEQRRDLVAAQRRRQVANWRHTRDSHTRRPLTLGALCEALELALEEAEHYVQPYCNCDNPLDSESGYRCEYYDLDINPPTED